MSRASSGPDFLGIGAMRSGSTWLHRNLRAHPGLWLPPLKELHYFDAQARAPRWNPFSRAHLRQRLRFYRNPRAWRPEHLRFDLRYFPRRRSDDWYRSLFRAADGRVAGEITPRYSILEPQAIGRIAGLLPELKLVFVMRDPIARSWSQVTRDALAELGPAARSLPAEEWMRRLGSEGVRRRSDYPAILGHWGSHFDPSRMLLAFFEEIESSPRALLKRLFAFLGVDDPGEDYYEAERVEARANPTPGEPLAIPGEVRRFLAREYRDILRELHERFGGRASHWYRSALETPAAPESPAVA